MENRKLLPIWLNVVFAVLVAVAIIGNLYTLVQAPATTGTISYLMKVVDFFAYFVALLYCLTGYKKDYAQYFRILCIAYAVALAVRMVNNAVNISLVGLQCLPGILFFMLAFAIMFTFAVSENMGRKRSFILVVILIACEIGTFCGVIAVLGSAFNILSAIGNLILAVIFAITVFAKYADKKARGTN